MLGNDALSSDSEQTVKQRRRPANSAGSHRSSSSSSWFSTVAAADEHTGALGRGSIRPRGRRREDQSQSAGSSARRTNYKRATSPDPNSDIDMELERERERDGERDTLVYVHHVKPTDTMEGVVIAFNIHPGALRKANGMWSHDGVQSRKTLLLPVDECRVKGKPVDSLDIGSNGTAKNKDAGKTVEGQQQGGQADPEGETPYKHESYVIIEGIGQVEIARLARKKLSHFPPRRRKGDSTLRLSSFDSPDYSAHLSLLDDPPLSTTDVFRGMTPGVGELHPQYNQNQNNHNSPPGGLKIGPGPGPGIALGPETFTMKTLGEIAQDTAAGLENVGSVVEGFVRRWTVKAQGFVGNDLIELTQRLGFEIEEGQAADGSAGMERSGSRRGGGGSAVSTAGDGGRRVVRERLTRREGERSKVL